LIPGFVENIVNLDQEYKITVTQKLQFLFGGLEQADKVVTEDMRKGHVAQSILAERADVAEALKDKFIEVLRDLSGVEGLLTDDERISAGQVEPKDVDIIKKPGVFIFPDLQSFASAPDMLIKYSSLLATVEMKFSKHYADPVSKKYFDQCQFQILTTGAVVGFLLLADSNKAPTLKSVDTVAAICDVNLHIIYPDQTWQKEMMSIGRLLFSLCTFLTPELLQGKAPTSLKKALELSPAGCSSVVTRNSRSYRINGCQGILYCKFVRFDSARADVQSNYPHVRQSIEVPLEEALHINRCINTSGVNGIYLVHCCLDHSGCAPPASLDKKFSLEQWSQIHKEVADLADKGVKSGDISRHLQQQYGLLKNSQDVKNILAAIETEKLAAEGKMLLTQTSKLIYAIDHLPCVAVSLFRIEKCDSKKTLVIKVVRVKGYSGETQKIAYLELTDWALMKDSFSDSLLACHLDASLPFPATSESVKPYLSHFDFSREVVLENQRKFVTAADTQAVLEAITWVNVGEMKTTSNFLETSMNDSTCNYGATGSLKFNLWLGESPSGRTLTIARSLFSETKNNFLFLFLVGGPMIYGVLMKMLVNFIADGNKEVHAAIKQAVESGFVGTKGLTFLASCFFHGGTQVFLKDYFCKTSGISGKTFKKEGFRKAIHERPHDDGDMGLTVYNWIKWAVYNAKTVEIFSKSLENLFRFIKKQPISSKYTYTYPPETVYTTQHQAILVQLVQDIRSLFPVMASCYNPSPVDFGLKTTSRNEGDFSVRKKLSNLNSKSTAASVVQFEQNLSETRSVSQQLSAHRNAFAVPVRLVGDRNFDVLRKLSPKARALLQEQISASQKYMVIRTSVTSFLVKLTEEGKIWHKRGDLSKPHLFDWEPEHEDTIITVVVDPNGVSRLLCKCFTCKHLYPCGCVIAIKRGLVDLFDIHLRYHIDFENGLYPFVKRSVSDLIDFKGAVFSPALDASYAISIEPLDATNTAVCFTFFFR
jgi:hypothetical protein